MSDVGLTLRDHQAYTLIMREEDDGTWSGEVLHGPLQKTIEWLTPCGVTCRAASKEELVEQLEAIIDKCAR